MRIIRQVVTPPSSCTAAREMPPWDGGDYGALGEYVSDLQAFIDDEEGDKACVRDYVTRSTSTAVAPGKP